MVNLEAEHLDDYYAVLGVNKNPDLETLKQSKKERLQKYHPDKSDHPKAEDYAQAINQAYETLSNPEKRKRYERKYDKYRKERRMIEEHSELELKTFYDIQYSQLISSLRLFLEPCFQIEPPASNEAIDVRMGPENNGPLNETYPSRGLPLLTSPGRGDLHIEIQVVYPDTMDDEDRQFFSMLADHGPDLFKIYVDTLEDSLLTKIPGHSHFEGTDSDLAGKEYLFEVKDSSDYRARFDDIMEKFRDRLG